MDDQELTLQEYAGQVTQDFEELTWLRSLSGRLEYCEASNSLEEVVRGILPELRQIVAAESLAFVVAKPEQTLLICEGNPEIVESSWPRLLQNAAASGIDSELPYVRNADLAHSGGLQDNQALQSCIVVRVAYKNAITGWLLAVNRRPRSLACRIRRTKLPTILFPNTSSARSRPAC